MADLESSISADLAFLSCVVDGPAVVRTSRVSGAIYDLLPARAGTPDSSRTGATSTAWLLTAALTGVLFLSSQGVLFVYGHDFDNERDASGAATDFILDHSQAGDGIVFHIAGTRVAYEFFRSLRAGTNTASPHFTAELGPEILFPQHGAGLDYRDFTGKPTADLLGSIGQSHRRIWVMLMNNGPAEKPDPTTAMLTEFCPNRFRKFSGGSSPRWNCGCIASDCLACGQRTRLKRKNKASFAELTKEADFMRCGLCCLISDRL